MESLIWLYFINALFLINHEIDSAYWKEWKLFHLKGDMFGFLIFNFIAIALFLYGFIEVIRNTFVGTIFSWIIALTGLFTFSIHMFFLSKGRKEFNVPISLFILYGTLIISIIQIVVLLI